MIVAKKLSICKEHCCFKADHGGGSRAEEEKKNKNKKPVHTAGKQKEKWQGLQLVLCMKPACQ